MSATALPIKKTKNNPDHIGLKGTLLVTSTLTVMAGSTIAPALPALTEAFATIPNINFVIRLVLTLPALFIAIGAPIAGYIVDRFGRKPLLVSATILYAFAGSAGYLIDNIWVLLMTRALLGIAVAGIMTTITTLIADYYSGEKRSSFLGIQGAFSGLGGVVFLSLGGVLADIGWRTPFLVYLFAFVILPFLITMIYEPTRASVPTASKGISSNSAKLPLGLIIFSYLTMMMSQIIFYSIPVQLPFYLEDLVSATATQSGLAIAALSLFFSIASASYGWFDRRLDHHYAMLLGFLITGSGFILISLAMGWIVLGIGLAAGGFGLGLVVPNLITWVASGVPEVMRGRALGGVTTSLFLGQFISPFIVTPLTNIVGAGGVYAALGIFLLGIAIIEFALRKQIKTLTYTDLKE
ncbi:MAG: MFS transporter [Phototrophicaceae bacterium]